MSRKLWLSQKCRAALSHFWAKQPMWHIKESTDARTIDYKVKNKADLPKLLAELLKGIPDNPPGTVNIQVVYRIAPIPPGSKKPEQPKA